MLPLTIAAAQVDVLLHPLKSELNYPVDLKSPIDLSPARWDLPAHVLAAVFPRDHAKAQDPAELWVTAERRCGFTRDTVAAQLSATIELGKSTHRMQRNPHLVLLDTDFYNVRLKPKVAMWTLLWMHRAMTEELSQFGLTNDVLLCYMIGYAKLYRIRQRTAVVEELLIMLQKLEASSVAERLVEALGSLPAERASDAAVDDADCCADVAAFTKAAKIAREFVIRDEEVVSVLSEFVAHAQNESLHAAKQALQAACASEERLPQKTMKLLNLSAGWCQQFLPHVLGKIDRVTFGLLGEHDSVPKDAPLVRRYMAVPFVAKVPHPCATTVGCIDAVCRMYRRMLQSSLIQMC